MRFISLLTRKELPKNILRSSCTVINRHCNCFETLTEAQKTLVEMNQVEVEYKKGETIAKQGSFATNIIFVCNGLIKVFLEDQNDTLILKIIPAENLVGLTTLSDGNNTFPYTAQAYQDSVVRLIDIKVFRKLIRENGAFATEIINILGQNSIQINGRFFCLTHKQSYGRMADIILCLAQRIFKENEFDLLLTRKEIGELAGMSTESVIRILKRFQEEKFITIDGKSFVINDPEALQKISELG